MTTAEIIAVAVGVVFVIAFFAIMRRPKTSGHITLEWRKNGDDEEE